ncbi:JmjC domain, hydroxylase-domain-containing protein [Protomyces lactucae-debilis]|uniref:[histone H3]-trimethyl-L-lysine(9) demethylase n=1 Tax=Protomyces lactucae-debilis TaxID=2754530 RepID=A0A1Y2EQS4_PROLT|nr:JmjC domain, hydroxylase-domain-containing protein [Protomyces lactucae-debilis]ORY73882.1 JmjC domain, hydroxylase-domain-containing protein [Protomyces lactucae-debilis]
MAHIGPMVTAHETPAPTNAPIIAPPTMQPEAAMTRSIAQTQHAPDAGLVADIKPDHYWADGAIPVFKPTMQQFKSFPDFIKKVDRYGMKAGIIKVIPPAEWLAQLPDLDDKVKDIRVKSAIEQQFAGTGGAFRQMNLEKQRSYNLQQWRKICDSLEHQPPAKRGKVRATGGLRSTTAAAVATERLATPPLSTDSDSEPDASVERPRSATKQQHKKGPSPAKKEKRIVNEEEDFDYRIDDNDQYTTKRCEELERAYWKSLTFNNPMYGADLPGSLFDDGTKDWNVAHLDNILNRLGVVLPGVNSAYLYLGMWKATFSWHVEDMDLYSINYIHFGAPKQWYSIAQEDNQKFERVMKEIFPNDARNCSQFMRHKTFGASPARLAQHGLHVNKLVHYEKEFVITFPYGYHSGYNMGYNCAESVNFATDSWLDFGRVAQKCDCVADAVSIDVRDIIRQLDGYSESDMSDSEGDESMLTPPRSVDGSAKRKPSRKRKLGATAQAYKKTGALFHGKRFKISLPKSPCSLCPNIASDEPLLKTDDGHSVHRICAELLPETQIEEHPDGSTTVTGFNLINKDRFSLKCSYCRATHGACFQCSSAKCVRSFHGTCAYMAGVLVEKLPATIQPEAFTFQCKSHRPRRLAVEQMEFDTNLAHFVEKLAVGEIAQCQYAAGLPFAGRVLENRAAERTVLMRVLGTTDFEIEVDYRWVMTKPRRVAMPARPSVSSILGTAAGILPPAFAVPQPQPLAQPAAIVPDSTALGPSPTALAA